MLKELPKLLDRDFLIGFYLPAGVFLLTVVLVLAPHPFVSMLIDLFTKDLVGGAVVAIIVIGFLAVHLAIANRSLIRFLEGYYFPLNSIPWLKRRQIKRYKDLENRISKIEEKWEELENGDPDEFRRASDERDDCLRQLAERFPDKKEDILPTAFGNIVRSFEVYPKIVYGADSIPTYYRLMSVAPESTQKQITADKSVVDYCINVIFLSLAICPIIVFRIHWEWNSIGGFRWGSIFQTTYFFWSTWWEIIALAAALLLARAAYGWAMDAALGWGQGVKAAFDLYLDDLAKQLGYEPPISGKTWEGISQTFLYRDPLPPKKPEEPPATSEPKPHAASAEPHAEATEPATPAK